MAKLNPYEIAINKAYESIDKDKFYYDTYEDAYNLIRALREEDNGKLISRANELNSELRRRISHALSNAKDDPQLVMRLYNLFEKSLFIQAHENFDCYLRYLEWDREPEKQFYMPRRKVLYPITKDLQDLEDGVIDFLGVSLPPRVGKSTLGIFFLTWLMGKRPNVANLMSGYSDTLVSSFYGEVLNILTEPETYRFNMVFPEAPLVDKSAEYKTINLDKKTRFATLTCRSILGSLTGSVEVGTHGILYCDDLIEDLEEANNPRRLDAKYDAYMNQLRDRMKDGAKELMVGTRWNVDDPLGRIYRQYHDDPRYRFRVIPALNEKDESNFNYKYGVGFSTEYYLKMRNDLDPADWSAKYMGEPYVREGLLYEREELKRYFKLPDEQPDAIIAVCDTKDKGPDYAVLLVVYVYGFDYYLVDCICDNEKPEIVEARIANMLVKHNVQTAQFESNAAGSRIARDVEKEARAHGGRVKITPKFTTSNKETKIIVNSPWVKENILFKDESIKSSSDYNKMLTFLTTYTTSGKNIHDDVPDAMAMLAQYCQELAGGMVEAIQRPF